MGVGPALIPANLIDLHWIEMAASADCLISDDLLTRIGNTPLLPIRLASRPGVPVYAKAEFLNPGGSVKDRPAYNMIRKGEASGELRPGKILLDSTSGNTGIAYAMICAAKGYQSSACAYRRTHRPNVSRFSKRLGPNSS